MFCRSQPLVQRSRSRAVILMCRLSCPPISLLRSPTPASCPMVFSLFRFPPAFGMQVRSTFYFELLLESKVPNFLRALPLGNPGSRQRLACSLGAPLHKICPPDQVRLESFPRDLCHSALPRCLRNRFLACTDPVEDVAFMPCIPVAATLSACNSAVRSEGIELGLGWRDLFVP